MPSTFKKQTKHTKESFACYIRILILDEGIIPPHTVVAVLIYF